MEDYIPDEEMNEALSAGYGILRDSGVKLIPESQEDYIKRISQEDITIENFLKNIKLESK